MILVGSLACAHLSSTEIYRGRVPSICKFFTNCPLVVVINSSMADVVWGRRSERVVSSETRSIKKQFLFFPRRNLAFGQRSTLLHCCGAHFAARGLETPPNADRCAPAAPLPVPAHVGAGGDRSPLSLPCPLSKSEGKWIKRCGRQITAQCAKP